MADQFGGGVSGEPTGRGVGVFDFPLGIGDDDGHRALLDCAGQLANLFSCLLAGVDVADGDQQLQVATYHCRPGADLGPEQPAVTMPGPPLGRRLALAHRHGDHLARVFLCEGFRSGAEIFDAHVMKRIPGVAEHPAGGFVHVEDFDVVRINDEDGVIDSVENRTGLPLAFAEVCLGAVDLL